MGPDKAIATVNDTSAQLWHGKRTSGTFSAYQCDKKKSESTTRSGIQPVARRFVEKKGVESATRSGGEVNATTIT